jgi:rod shape-determining protein MreB
MEKHIKVGFDLGTNNSAIVAEEDGKELDLKEDVIYTVVGYARPGILPGTLPNNKAKLYGREAIDYRSYLTLRWPLERGVITSTEVARDFVSHIRSLIDQTGKKEVWAVVGVSGRKDEKHISALREVIGASFSRYILAPESFLTALGVRDESKLSNPEYPDPIKHSLIVDIGAGTIDVCFLQGYYPSPDEEICIPKGGNDIDVTIRELINRQYPEVKLHDVSITRLKEENSYVGQPPKRVILKVYVEGKPSQFDVTEIVGEGCSIITADIVSAICELVKRCNQELVEKILGNIILAGGGSQIGGLVETIQEKLISEGYESAKVTRVDDFQRVVAKGALVIAKFAREDQWQTPIV